MPELEDHRVDGQVIMPGAGFVEMALACVREAMRDDEVVLADFEILSPMVFAEEALREVAVRLSGSGNGIQVLSRPRLTQTPWQLHAQAKIVEGTFSAPKVPDLNGFSFETAGDHVLTGDALYARALASGLGFGPSFQQVAMSARLDDATIVSDLLPAEPDSRYALVPNRLDACFHGLILLFADLLGENAGKAYIPVRFGEVRMLRPGAVITRSIIRTRRCNERSILADFTLLDAEGAVVATIREGRFQALRAKGGGDLVGLRDLAECRNSPPSRRRSRWSAVRAWPRACVPSPPRRRGRPTPPCRRGTSCWRAGRPPSPTASLPVWRRARPCRSPTGAFPRPCVPGCGTPSTPSKAAASPSARARTGFWATAPRCRRRTRSCAGSRVTTRISRPNSS